LNYPNYPVGWSIIALFFYFTGLGDLLITTPYLISVFAWLLIGGVLLWFSKGLDWKRQSFVILAFYFFPPAQILFKNYHLHSYIYLLLICVVLIQIRYIETLSKYQLCSILLLSSFVCSLKHIGMIFTMLIGFCTVLCLKNQNNRYGLVGITYLASCLIGLCFYNLAEVNNYVASILGHNPKLSEPGIIYLAVAAIFGLVAVFGFNYRKVNKIKMNISFSLFPYIWIIPFLMLFFVAIFPLVKMSTLIPLVIWVFVIIFLRFDKTYPLTHQLWLHFVFSLFLVSAGIYNAHLFNVSRIFYPSLFLVWIVFLRTCTYKTGILWLVVMGFVSNWYPSYKTSLSTYGLSLWHYNYTFQNYNSNYLGWQKSIVSELNKYMFDILANYRIDETLLAGFPISDQDSDYLLRSLHDFKNPIRLKSMPDVKQSDIINCIHKGNCAANILAEVIPIILYEPESDNSIYDYELKDYEHIKNGGSCTPPIADMATLTENDIYPPLCYKHLFKAIYRNHYSELKDEYNLHEIKIDEKVYIIGVSKRLPQLNE
jgi:hypothetical protein